MTGKCPVCGSDEYDNVFDAPDLSLEFGEFFVGPILDGRKSSSIRYQLGDRPQAGDLISLRTEDDEEFAWARCTERVELTAEAIVDGNFDSHYNYDSVEELALSMRKFYPNAYIGPETELTVISFWPFKKVNEDYFDSDV